MSHSQRAALVAGVASVLFLITGVMLAAAGCGEADPTTTTTQTTTTQESEGDQVVLAMADIPRSAPAATEEDVASAAASIQDFAVDLYGLLAQGADDGNLVFSPTSIVTALAMAYAGAAGATAEEMASTLHFTLEDDALHQAFNSLDVALESRSWQGKDPDGNDQGVLAKTANSLWGQRDTVFEQIFLDTLAADYGAGMRLVDFKTAAKDARRVINDWVADETADKITDLIPEGALDSLTRLVLVNAVYLDATWAQQFTPELTREGEFTTLAGRTVTADMMFQSSSFQYAAGDGWQAVELPYLTDNPQRGELSMLVILPQAGGLGEVEGRLGAGLIDEVVGQLAGGPIVDLAMPKPESTARRP